jgi:hypothetical protein
VLGAASQTGQVSAQTGVQDRAQLNEQPAPLAWAALCLITVYEYTHTLIWRYRGVLRLKRIQAVKEFYGFPIPTLTRLKTHDMPDATLAIPSRSCRSKPPSLLPLQSQAQFSKGRFGICPELGANHVVHPCRPLQNR